MKKDSFKLPFKSNFFKEQDPFHLVIIFFIIFFGTAIFFSIPTFYDYKKYNQQIEKTINNEFKVYIHNLENISFRFVPSPHLLIKKADLKINESEQNLVSELENLKVFISITDLYKRDIFKIKRAEVKKANIYINNASLKNFIYNLKKNIVNNFILKKSNIFFKNEKDEIILISTIKDLNYKIDFLNNKKIFSINGNIFDADYKFNYLIDYSKPNIQNANLELKKPNLLFSNILIDDITKSITNQNGKLEIRFFNNKNSINYEIIDNTINFVNKENKNSNFDLNGLINFQPFHFDLNLDLKKTSILEIEKLLYFLYVNQLNNYENLSGNLKINFKNIDHKVMKTGIINLFFENSNILSKNKIFNLKDYASIEVSDYEYLDDNDQILQMKVKINIFDSMKFNRFLFNYNKDKIKKKNLYLTYRFNVNTKVSFISRISFTGYNKETEFYQFKNLQQLKNLLKDDNIYN